MDRSETKSVLIPVLGGKQLQGGHLFHLRVSAGVATTASHAFQNRCMKFHMMLYCYVQGGKKEIAGVYDKKMTH